MIYSIQEIQDRVLPVAIQYGLRAVYLFGSYARGEATEDSDIDLLVDTAGTQLKSLLSLGALYCDLEEALGKRVDLITQESLNQASQMPSEDVFKEVLIKERVVLFTDTDKNPQTILR